MNKSLFLFFVGVLFLLILLKPLYDSYLTLKKGYESTRWESVIGVIEESKIISVEYSSAKTRTTKNYKLYFKVTYFVNDVKYIKEGRFIDGKESSSNYKDNELLDFVKNHKKGDEIKVFYNPTNPVEANIKNGILFRNIVVFSVILIFQVFSLLLIVGFLKKNK